MKWMALIVLTVSLACIPMLAQEKAPAAGAAGLAPAGAHTAGADWIAAAKETHAKFKGEKGTLANFGDSITISGAYWQSIQGGGKNMDKPTQAAYDLVKSHMKKDCWGWKGPEYGNTGSMTINWARDNVDKWLAKTNPEVAIIMFGSNDCPGMKLEEYEASYRTVIEKCAANGTILVLMTMPPKHGCDEKAKLYVEVVRKLAKECKLPLSDYYKAIKDRRPDDWDGADAKFKPAEGEKADVYNVKAPISRDGVHPSNPSAYGGDFSEEGLKNNGFLLRSWCSLMSYADVIANACQTK